MSSKPFLHSPGLVASSELLFTKKVAKKRTPREKGSFDYQYSSMIFLILSESELRFIV